MIITTAQQLGALLRRARTDAGMTQAALAAATGVSRQWVISAEAGAPTARLDLVIDALRAVGLVLDVVPEEQDDALDEVLGRTRA
ncbi:transcriptional regulator, XRE family [Xylanimonas cellulosilytica DSM 15894]|uniref:Transcriptional regulator, XRE family n=1 Tax=Xylanimonas cellulosilytica (strain DSM 15894 / JCM 12276 / CECT 5975 / KCTC 9989 / LMG 20990 / NBRC 107835 / XIL07) TaxID=446471 RepID=D1BST5_XYLCX|nr:helix-turn-helix domain-containing protein [Xylanimonas cellulosilytica]ACZ30777.1 transcriptional regulator, XRE family [Xylanimonas cellulosilytica DSM 15894]